MTIQTTSAAETTEKLLRGGLSLRQRAENAFHGISIQSTHPLEAISPEENLQTLYELHVHQIELEMQNEELRRSQQELSAEQARYFDLYDQAPVGYCIVNEAGLIVQANFTAAALLGEVRGALLKRPIYSLIFIDDQDIYYLLRKRLVATGNAQTCELRMVKHDGTQFWAQLEAVMAQGDNDMPVLRIVLSNISGRKQAEDQLLQMAAGLEEKVDQRTRQLRAVSAQLTRTEEHERCLLAQELHDNLGQLLAVIKIKLTSLGAGAPPASINQIMGLVDEAQHSARMITQQLSPPILHTLGLIPALKWLAEEKERRYGLAVHIDNKIVCPKPLKQEIRALLYRSVGELLVNVSKHAKVSDASLSCLCSKGRLLFIVSDKGCGFDAADFSGDFSGLQGFGLSSIYQRITNIGGKMDIDSRSGEGTTITLSMPCSIAESEGHDDPNYACR